MGKRAEDLTGKRFHRLTVLKEAESAKGGRRWLCRCDCGREKILYGSSLKRGSTKSCGCMSKEWKQARGKEHFAKAYEVYRTRKGTLCVSCIRSAAPPELQCIWDRSHAKKLPEGAKAEYVEKKSEGGTKYTIVTACPEYLSLHDGKNQAQLKEARKKNAALWALEQAAKSGGMGGGLLLNEEAGEP